MNKFAKYNVGRFDFPIAPPRKSDIVKVDVPDKYQQLLDMIYTPDSRGGRPRGDIAMFLGDNTNPEVRTFIQNQLMQEVDTDRSSLSLPESVVNNLRKTITDDDIARFTRNHDESVDAYAERMSSFFNEQRYQAKLRALDKEFNKSISKHD